MAPTLSLHQALKSWNKELGGRAYLGSILMKNEDIPEFKDSMLDYDWLLEVSKDRKCVVLSTPLVIRYVDGNNLSLQPEYRRKDFYLIMSIIDGDLSAMKRLCGTRARYHYYVGETKLARYWFRHANFHWKIILYYFTSYSEFLRKYVCKKFKVFGERGTL